MGCKHRLAWRGRHKLKHKSAQGSRRADPLDFGAIDFEVIDFEVLDWDIKELVPDPAGWDLDLKALDFDVDFKALDWTPLDFPDITFPFDVELLEDVRF